MCGFVGLVGRGEIEPRQVVESMRDQLMHRGPDGEGFWQTDLGMSSVSFGFRRLAIVDLREEANQPMVSGDGNFVIVFNGEIYNFVELRAELEREGRVFRTKGDTEVLLQGYQHWGERVVERLNGMFAFIIFNKCRSEVFVARDRFGEKPLYMCELSEGKYAFASEIKAILAHPRANVSYDLDKFRDVLSGHILFGTDKTLFQNIRQFPAAHCMTISVQGDVISERRYWTPEYSQKLAGKTSEELEHELRELLDNSLKMRMRTDVQVTACLSGGLDSSSLVASSASFSFEERTIDSTISVRFPNDASIDEGHFIDQVLQRTNLNGITVTPTASECAKDIRSLHWHHETIIPGPSMYLEWALMRRARAGGYKVILDGQGADEIFAGYSCYLRAYQAELGSRGNLGLLRALMMGWKRDLRLYRVAKQYPEADRRFALSESLKLLDYKKYYNEIAKKRIEEYGANGMPQIDRVGALRFELALNLLRTSLPSNLYSGDRNSMAHGIEARYPFLDYRLVDFALQLSDSELIDDAWGKSILRKAMATKLPPEVVWRVDKVGFAAPQDKWMQTSELKSWVEDRVFDESLKQIDGYSKYNLAKVWKALKMGDSSSAALLWQWASAAELLDMKEKWIVTQ